jgi:hypothetical protein
VAKFDGFFVSDAVHERRVTLADGTEHVLHFRELSVTDWRTWGFAERSEDDEVRAAAMSRLIAASLCEPDGSAAMTLEQALRLKPGVATALFTAVLDVNRVKREADEGNASRPAESNGSGT